MRGVVNDVQYAGFPELLYFRVLFFVDLKNARCDIWRT